MNCLVPSNTSSTHIHEHCNRIGKSFEVFVKYLVASGTIEYDRYLINFAYEIGYSHDLGKLLIDEKILLKPSKLTQDEMIDMKSHVEKGIVAYESYRKELQFSEQEEVITLVQDCITTHHEHWNGLGYPRGLKETDISLVGRICAILDAYDVITHKRPYKNASTSSDAIAEIIRCSGLQFDPILVKSFQEMWKYGKL